ncbi:RFC5 [Cordylochernes scorpioides]|uniref:RFC5 n=1 Tax=Cordylochernes scorpioides TaxID=51811 RepID=A0ABY6K088_9ARAC|nr:RFC5 [Cordylochernes scorpioides]
MCRLDVSEDGKTALVDLAQGDMRKVLNILQSTSMAFPKVTEDTVYMCVGHPLKSDITSIVTWLLNEPFSYTYRRILIVLRSSYATPYCYRRTSFVQRRYCSQ